MTYQYKPGINPEEKMTATDRNTGEVVETERYVLLNAAHCGCTPGTLLDMKTNRYVYPVVERPPVNARKSILASWPGKRSDNRFIVHSAPST